MKNTTLALLILGFLSLNCNKRTDNKGCTVIDFKYYKGEKYNLGSMSDKYLLVAFDTSNSDAQIKNFISSLTDFDQDYNYNIQKSAQYKYKEVPLKFRTPKSCEEITQITSKLQKHLMVSYVHHTFQTDNCLNQIGQPMGNQCIVVYGSNFYVKVRDSGNPSGLDKMMALTKTELVEQDRFDKKLYILSATKSSIGDALAMANYFYESGLFEFSEPAVGKYAVE